MTMAATLGQRSNGKMGWLLAAAVVAVSGTSMAHAGLIHRYNFASNASDSVGTLNGTVNGTGVTFSGGAAVFNGTAGSYLSFGSNDIAATSGVTGALSLEYWAKINWNGDATPIYVFGSGDTNRITHWSGNGQHLLVNAGGKSGGVDNWGLTGPVAFSNGNYVHFVDVFDQASNTVKIYANGVLYNTSSLGGVSLANLSSSFFNIGGPIVPKTGTQDYLKGAVSEFRIFDTALDSTTISAYHQAGPDSIPNIYDLHSVANTAWATGTTWAGTTPPPAGTPEASTVVTIAGNTVTLNGASGSVLGVTVGAGGSLALTGGTLTVGAVLDTSAGGLSLDGTSVLNTANINNTSLAGVTAATGATINVNGTLSLTTALPALTGANLSVKGISVAGTSFSTAAVGTFALNGPVSVSSNGTFTLAGGSQTATSVLVDGTQSVLNVNTTLAINGQVNSLTNGGKLVVTDAAVTAKGGIDIGHDGQVGAMVVQGTGTLTSNGDVQLGRNTGAASIIVKDNGVLTGGTNTLRMGTDNVRSVYVRLQDNAAATFGNVILLNSNNYGEGGQGSGSVLVIADNAKLTTNSMTVANTMTNGNTVHPKYGNAQVYQSGGTVTVNGNISVSVSKPSAADVLIGTYNLNGGILKTRQINTGTPLTGGVSGTANVNFHGGTLTYNGTTNQADFINLGANGSLYLYEGVTIDSGGKDITVNQAMLSPNSGSGLAPITLATPIGAANAFPVTPEVLVTGGGGSGATAVAVLNASGQVSGVTVTNPGVGYSSNPTVTLYYQGATTAIPAGSITLNTGNAYTGGLTKIGAGMLTLGAASTYTGATNINAGKLVLNSTGSVNNSSGIAVNGPGAIFMTYSNTAITSPTSVTQGTIGGTGRISAAGGVVIAQNATVAPGASPGTQEYTTGLTFGPGGTYQWEINDANGVAGTNSDLLNVTGFNLTADSSAPFTIAVTGLDAANAVGVVPNFDNTLAYSWLVLNADAAITGIAAAKFNLDTTSFATSNPLSVDGNFSIVRGDAVGIGGTDRQLWLHYSPTPVPEPASLALLAGAAILLPMRRRSRKA